MYIKIIKIRKRRKSSKYGYLANHPTETSITEVQFSKSNLWIFCHIMMRLKKYVVGVAVVSVVAVVALVALVAVAAVIA